MNRYLFVYGTLRKNAASPLKSFLMRHSTYIDTGKIEGKLYRISWYPGAIEAKGHYVLGDVFELHNPNTCLRKLDVYEDVPSLYIRKETPVYLSDGRMITAWVYFYNQPVIGYQEITSGDFLQPSNS